MAFRRTNRLATLLGALLGAIAPVVTYTVSHNAITTDIPLHLQTASYIVAGGLLFSAYSVVSWASRAFSSPAKAIGWTLLLEGTMTFLGIGWLAVLCLVYLVAINAIATGCNLSLDRQAETKARRAAARASRPARSTPRATVTPIRAAK
jgi:hypothetical protein